MQDSKKLAVLKNVVKVMSVLLVIGAVVLTVSLVRVYQSLSSNQTSADGKNCHYTDDKLAVKGRILSATLSHNTLVIVNESLGGEQQVVLIDLCTNRLMHQYTIEEHDDQ